MNVTVVSDDWEMPKNETTLDGIVPAGTNVVSALPHAFLSIGQTPWINLHVIGGAYKEIGKMIERITKRGVRVAKKKDGTSRIPLNIPPIKELMVHFSYAGKFTIAHVFHNGKVWVGAAKRNPIDKGNPNVGASVALYRALTDISRDPNRENFSFEIPYSIETETQVVAPSTTQR